MYPAIEELVQLPTDELRRRRREAAETLAIVRDAPRAASEEVLEARRELPAFIRRIGQALSIQRKRSA